MLDDFNRRARERTTPLMLRDCRDEIARAEYLKVALDLRVHSRAQERGKVERSSVLAIGIEQPYHVEASDAAKDRRSIRTRDRFEAVDRADSERARSHARSDNRSARILEPIAAAKGCRGASTPLRFAARLKNRWALPSLRARGPATS